ncbi:MAG: hypothetical protein ACI38A_01060, partial [Candidatus Ornithomonoglobus sp.]
ENPFSGWRKGFERANMATLETMLNVNIIGGKGSYIGQTGGPRTFKRGPGAVLERGLGYGMGSTDEFQKGMIDGQMRKMYRRLVDEGYYTPAEMEKMIRGEMLYRTFQDDTLPAKMLNDIHNALNRVGIGKVDANGIHEFGVGDLLTPYTTVGGNIVSRTVEYSPLGALKAIYDIAQISKQVYRDNKVIAMQNQENGVGFTPRGLHSEAFTASMQRRVVMDIARPLTAAGIIVAGFGLRNLGIIIGTSDNGDYSEEQYENSKGLGDFKINLSQLKRFITGEYDGHAQAGDALADIGWLVGINTALSTGAALSDIVAADDGYLNPVLIMNTSLNLSGNVVGDLSLFSGINKAINNWKYTDGMAEFAAAELGDFVLSFNPALINQVANTSDNYSRNPYKEDGPLNTFIGKLKNKSFIPSVRDDVPLRIDIWGQPEENTLGSTGLDIVNNSFLPGFVDKYKVNELTAEFDRLLEMSTDILPRIPAREYKFSLDGHTYEFKLNGKDYEQYAQFLGQTTYNNMAAFVTSEDYHLLSDQQRIDTLEKIAQYTPYTVRKLWVKYQNKGMEANPEVRAALDADLEEYSQAAANYVRERQAAEYIQRDDVNVEDVVSVYNEVPYTDGEIKGQIAYNKEKIEKIKAGTYYEYRYRDDGSEYKLYASNWTDEERRSEIAYLESINKRLADGSLTDKKYITGHFSDLSAADKEKVLSQISRYPSEVRLPDDLPKPDMSQEGSEHIDVTGKRSYNEMKMILQSQGYSMGEKNKGIDTENKSVTITPKNTKSEIDPDSIKPSSSLKSIYNNFKRGGSYYRRRSYSRRTWRRSTKRYYYKNYSRRTYSRRTYSGRQYSQRTRTSSSRFTPGGSGRFTVGGKSRFAGFGNSSAYRFIPRFGEVENDVYK